MPKKWILGLHTVEEQHEALDIAQDAVKAGREAIRNQDFMTAAYQLGYLAAISDLAVREHVKKLAEDIGMLYNELDSALKEVIGG